jgi:hypothetical protein
MARQWASGSRHASLCIQNAIVFVVHSLRLSTPQTCATLFTTLTSANHSPPQNPTRSLPSAGTVETGIHLCRVHFFSVPVAIEGEHLPTEVGYDTELQSYQDPGEEDELPRDGF